MSMKLNRELPLPADLKAQYPLSASLREMKARRDKEVRDIFTGQSEIFEIGRAHV